MKPNQETSIAVWCDSCKTRLKAQNRLAGKTVSCRCGAPLKIPTIAEPAPQDEAFGLPAKAARAHLPPPPPAPSPTKAPSQASRERTFNVRVLAASCLATAVLVSLAGFVIVRLTGKAEWSVAALPEDTSVTPTAAEPAPTAAVGVDAAEIAAESETPSDIGAAESPDTTEIDANVPMSEASGTKEAPHP